MPTVSYPSLSLSVSLSVSRALSLTHSLTHSFSLKQRHLRNRLLRSASESTSHNRKHLQRQRVSASASVPTRQCQRVSANASVPARQCLFEDTCSKRSYRNSGQKPLQRQRVRAYFRTYGAQALKEAVKEAVRAGKSPPRTRKRLPRGVSEAAVHVQRHDPHRRLKRLDRRIAASPLFLARSLSLSFSLSLCWHLVFLLSLSLFPVLFLVRNTGG